VTDNLTAEIEKAMRQHTYSVRLMNGKIEPVMLPSKAVAVCVAKVEHTKKMGRAAAEQAVQEERERIENSTPSGASTLLHWAADRMIHIYHESEHTDFVLALRRVADAIKVRDGSTAAEREKLDRAHKLTLASIMTHADKRVLAERERCFTAVHDAPMSASRGELLDAIRNEPYFLPRKSRRVLAYAIRNESKPPPEPPTCGTCGGSGLSGELSYGGFAKPCPDCQKETSCGTCGSDDPRFMVSSNGVALRECPDPFHGTKKETP